MRLKRGVYSVLVVIFISGWLPVLGAPQPLMRSEAHELEGWLTAFREALAQQDQAALERLWSLRPPLKLNGQDLAGLLRLIPDGQPAPPDQLILQSLHMLRQPMEKAEISEEDLGPEALSELLPGREQTAFWKEKALKVVLPLLKDSDPDLRHAAANALGWMRDPRALPALIERLQSDKDGWVRQAAARALGRIGDSGATPALIAALNDPECEFSLFLPKPCVAEAAAEALGQLRDRTAVPALLAAARHPAIEVAVAAVRALRRIADPASIEPLLELARHRPRGGLFWPVLSDEIALALASMGQPALPALLRTLDEPNLFARFVAAAALGHMREVSVLSALERAFLRARYKDPAAAEYAEALGLLGDHSAVQILIEAINDIDSDLVEAAVRALGVLRAEAAVPELIRLYKQGWGSLRLFIMIALIEIGPPAVPALIASLSESLAGIRAGLVEILGEIGDPQATPALIDALQRDVDDGVRRNAASALGRMKALAAVEPLIRALKSDRSEHVRAAAAWTLGNISDRRALPALIGALNDPACDDKTKLACVPAFAALALGRLKDRSAVSALITALSHHHRYVREAVAEALGEIADPEATPALIEALREPTVNQSVREALATALVKIGEPALPALIEALQTHPHYLVRRAAALILGRIGNLVAVPKLIGALEDPSSDVRARAAIALGWLKDPKAVPPLLQRLAQDIEAIVRLEAAKALGLIGDTRAVPGLIEALQKDICRYEACVRAAAAKALGQLGDRIATPMLIQALEQDTELMVREAAAEALGELKEEAAITALIRALAGYPWGAVQGAAAEALVKIGQAAIPALLQTLQAEDAAARRWAAFALGEIKDLKTLPALVQALHDPEEDVRSTAAGALGKLGDPAAIPALIATLADKDSGVAFSAAEALVAIGNSAVPLLLPALSDKRLQVRLAAVYILGQLKAAAAVPALLEMLNDAVNKVRTLVARALGNIGDPRAVKPLISLLERSVRADPNTFTYAMALGRLGQPALPALLGALQHMEVAIREAAAWALSLIPTSESIPSLVQALEDPSPLVRRGAAYTLGRIGDERAVAALIRTLSDEDTATRIQAIRALGRLGDRRATPALLQLLHGPKACLQEPGTFFDEPPCLRPEAALALGQLRDPAALPHLLKALRDDTEKGVRKAAAEALGMLGDPAAVPLLIESLQSEQDPDIRRTVAFALAELNDPRAIEPLLQLAYGEDEYLREYATWALIRLNIRVGLPVLFELLAEMLLDLENAPPELKELMLLRLVLFLFITKLYVGEELLEHADLTVEALREALQNPQPIIRVAALFFTIILPDSFFYRSEAAKLITPLVRSLQDRESTIQALAADLLAQIAQRAKFNVTRQLTAEAMPKLLPFLDKRSDKYVQMYAAKAVYLIARRADELRSALEKLGR